MSNLKNISLMMLGYIVAFLFDLILLPIGLYLTLFYVIHDKLGIKYKYDENKKNIIFIHGSGFNRSEWILANYYLSNYNIYSFNYLKNYGLYGNNEAESIEEYADKLKDYINSLNIKSCTLIGHSMGGLIASYYSETLRKDKDVEIEKIITISTPWYGSKILEYYWNILNYFRNNKYLKNLPYRYYRIVMDYLTFPKRYIQMSPNSEFLKNLIFTIDENKNNYKYLCIGSEHDLLVHSNNAILSGANHVTTKYIGHYWIIVSSFIWNKILEFSNIDKINNNIK